MIKIIKEGTRKECTCEKCGCVFSYEQEDICHIETHRNETEYIQGIRAGYKSLIICPQCGNEIVLEATRDEILMELQKMWGEQWAITLDVVGGRPDVFDIYPKEYIERSNELVRALNRMG